MIEVAKELGISDVALKKRCAKLQVPTPSRGYWAKLRSGQKLKKPPLKAFVEHLAEKQAKKPKGHVSLTEGQWDFLGRALMLLEKDGVDTSGCHYPRYEIRSIDPELAADVIVRVQRHYGEWGAAGTSFRKHQGAHQCAGNLIAKLLPVAKSHVLVLGSAKERSYGGPDNTIYVRVTPAFVQDVASLLRVVRENRLNHVAKPLSRSSHAWRPRFVGPPEGTIASVSQVLVSSSELWFRGRVGWGYDEVDVETERLALSAIAPEELLVPEFFEIREDWVEEQLDAYRDRLQAIDAAESLYQSIADSIEWGESDSPSATVALMERLWFGQGENNLLQSQRQRFRELAEVLEEWESILEREKADLTRDVLGIGPGDDVSFTRRGKLIRIRVQHASVYSSGDELHFYMVGLKYRKDGLVGKIDERLHLTVSAR